MNFQNEEVALMNRLESREPEIGMASAILGDETFRQVTISSIGTIRQERLVETLEFSTGMKRMFTQRRNGRWIERGEAAKHGTPLIIGFPREE